MTTMNAEVRESVWDYPRPPHVERCPRRVRVVAGDITIADSVRALRVLETSHPPAIYVPAEDVRMDLLRPSPRRTACEYKGLASYWSLAAPVAAPGDVAWSYEDPLPGYETLRGCIAFYPGRVDACYLDDERVTPQAGDFYGGWVTAEIEGPFKGGPGTFGW